MPHPPHLEQLEISRRLDTIDNQINAERDHKIKLRTLKTGLMQDLLTGKVRVKVDQYEENTADV